MAKITINHEGNEMEFEGTPEEIKEMLTSMGVKPAEVEEVEGNEEANEEATKGFQVGDYVRVTKDVNEHREGDVLEITSRDKRPLEYGVRNTRISPEASTGHTGWIDEENFEPIEFIEGDPKVGDKILVVNKRGTLGEYRNGDVLTVTEVGDHFPAEYFVRVEEEGYNPVIFRNEFEIIERATAESPFEVGDLAVIAEEADEGRLKIGDVVEIIGTGRFFDFEAKRLTDGKTENFDEEELTEYVPEEKEISVGDKVVLAIPKGEKPKYGFGDVKTGDIGEVLSVFGGGTELSIKFDNHPGWRGITSEVLLVERAETKAEEAEEGGEEPTTFVKGDIVKIIGRTRFGDVSTGATARVVSGVLDYDGELKVEYLDVSDYDYAKPEALAKVAEKVAEDVSEEIEVGDIVRVLSQEHSGSRNLPGDIGEVVGVNGFGFFVDVKSRDIPGASGNHHVRENLQLVAKHSDRKDV